MRVRDRLSPRLLKALSEEMFAGDADEDGWIDFIDDEKLIAFLKKGQSPLRS